MKKRLLTLSVQQRVCTAVGKSQELEILKVRSISLSISSVFILKR
jgi:hypothetical protein